MDDRNIVRAVLFSAAVNIEIEIARRGVPSGMLSEADGEALRELIVNEASNRVDALVDAADIHDEDSEDEEPESEEGTHEDMLNHLVGVFMHAMGNETCGTCKKCGEHIEGVKAMRSHIAKHEAEKGKSTK